jgi:uncharacterized membrane protein
MADNLCELSVESGGDAGWNFHWLHVIVRIKFSFYVLVLHKKNIDLRNIRQGSMSVLIEIITGYVVSSKKLNIVT